MRAAANVSVVPAQSVGFPTVSKRPFIVFGIFAAICLLALPIFALGKEGDEDAGTVQVASQDQEAKSMFQTVGSLPSGLGASPATFFASRPHARV